MATGDNAAGGRPSKPGFQEVIDAIDRNTRVEVNELRAELRAEMRSEMQEMRALIATTLGIDAVTNVIENGFGALSDDLRRLVPPTNASYLPEQAAAQIGNLRKSLDRPNLGNIQALKIPVSIVPFIGEVDYDGKAGRE
jgi:hypothetical protein